LQLQYVGRLFVQYVYSQSTADNALLGRIDHTTVNFILKNKHAEMEFSKFYLCGPEEMINLVSNTLKENNISDSDIKFELFSTASNDKEATSGADGHTEISILVDSEETTFEMSQKQTLLEAALKQGLDVPYSCQGGICSSCICRITEGAAEMKKNQILNESEVAEGLTLACQAYPTTTTIKIDFDDV
jgi:ring-1,2-phenylacetyl-CoA epoxidase subunit PaaE